MNLKILFTSTTLFFMMAVHAQNKNKNETFRVEGNCGMCESRIEKAAMKVKGVKLASWDSKSKDFTVIFNENTCSLDHIKSAIVKIGHDIDTLKANQAVYDKLPACCKYRDPKSMEMNHH